MAYSVLPIYVFVTIFYIVFPGGVDSIVLNETFAAKLKLNIGNKELLKYADKTGESHYLDINQPRQTVVAEHAVNLTLDCGSLLTGKSSISWSVLYDEDIDYTGISDSSNIHGVGNSQLTLLTNIDNSAANVLGNSGTYKCAGSNGLHRNITIFVIGAAPILDVSNEKPESNTESVVALTTHDDSYRESQTYKIGSQFCLERSKFKYCQIMIACSKLNEKSLPPAIPAPSVKWILNNEIIHEDTESMMNTDFLESGNNKLLSPGLINPIPLTFSNSLEFVTINLCLWNITSELIPEGINIDNIHDNLFELILGNWTCQQNNSLGSSSASTLISECGVDLSFEQKRLIVNESDESLTICIRHFLGVNSFIISSTNVEAEASQDFISVNISWSRGDPKPCFKVYLVNDNITEFVESFELRLESHGFKTKTSSTRNQFMTVVIEDDDHSITETPMCNLASHLLISDIKEDKEILLEKVAEKILVKQIFPNISLDTHNVEQTYEQIAHALGKESSTDGVNSFINALNSIQDSYASTCNSEELEIPPPSTLSKLVEDFKKATNIHVGNSTLAQTIFGQFLCYSELENKKNSNTRFKRRAARESVLPTICECPDEVSTPCEFFACLTVEEVEVLLEFGNTDYGEPCIAFLIDTTGSMREEIESAKNVILQFLKAQRNSTTCYMLVPFNDHDDNDYFYSDTNYCNFDGTEMNVGPIQHAFTYGDTHDDIEDFVAAVNSLSACGGGDGPEYALSAISETLDYEVVYSDGYIRKLMSAHSHMILITDHKSKLESLSSSVINKAWEQEVNVSFIVPSDLNYEPYTSIARSTGGIVHYSNIASITWALAAFALEWSDSIGSRKKRSASLPELFSVAVSHISENLQVLSYCSVIPSNYVTITHPDHTTEIVYIVDSTMIFLNANPQPGVYNFDFGYNLCDTQNNLGCNLNTEIIYTSNDFSASSSLPPPACSLARIAVTTISISKINSLSLNISDSEGKYDILHLTKCSNAYIAKFKFPQGNFSYNYFGVDIDNIEFTCNPNIAVSFEKSNKYSFQAINESIITMEYTGRLILEYEIHSSTAIGSSNFSFFSSNVRGFETLITPSSIELPPHQNATITLTTRIVSLNIPGGSTHYFSIYADNGCIRLSNSVMVTVKPKPTVPPKEAETNECGCLNGGTCVITHRGRRRIIRCICPPNYRRSRCQTPNE